MPKFVICFRCKSKITADDFGYLKLTFGPYEPPVFRHIVCPGESLEPKRRKETWVERLDRDREGSEASNG